MKYLKALGLAAIAAATLVIAAAGPVSAETTVCANTSGTECYPVGQEVKAVSVATPEVTTEGGTKHSAISRPTSTGGLGPMSCDVAVEGTSEKATTPSGKGKETTVNCTGGTNTAATNGTITVHHDAEHNGTVTFEGFVRKVVQAGIPCYYSSEGVHGTLTGGSPAIIHITSTVAKIDTATHDSSAFCPAAVITHATYEVKTPGSAYVIAGV